MIQFKMLKKRFMMLEVIHQNSKDLSMLDYNYKMEELSKIIKSKNNQRFI
jgi:hypothetical protein